ncbi:MAG: hypothetical protein ACF8R7_07605 [Phycisphaerales bacterium JB039]
MFRACIVFAAAAAATLTPAISARQAEARPQSQRTDELLSETFRATQSGQPERERAARQQAEQLAAELEREIDRLQAERDQLEQRERRLREAQPERPRAAEPAEDRHIAIIEGLERGVWALRELGAMEEAERLAQIAERVRQRAPDARRGQDRPQPDRIPRSERQVAREQLEVMRLAMPALREGERHDAAELLELAIHQRELNLTGQREQAAELRGRAPSRAQLAEILGQAAQLWADFDRPERARAVGELARQLAPRERAPEAQDQAERDRPAEQPDQSGDMRRRLEALRIAMHGLREGERADAAHIIERAIHLHELAMEGRQEEAHRIFEQEGPPPEQIMRALAMATELWRQFGHEGRAEAVAALQREVAAHMDELARQPARAPEQFDRMRRQLDEMTRAMDEMRAQMEAMRRQMEQQQMRRDR